LDQFEISKLVAKPLEFLIAHAELMRSLVLDKVLWQDSIIAKERFKKAKLAPYTVKTVEKYGLAPDLLKVAKHMQLEDDKVKKHVMDRLKQSNNNAGMVDGDDDVYEVKELKNILIVNNNNNGNNTGSSYEGEDADDADYADSKFPLSLQDYFGNHRITTRMEELRIEQGGRQVEIKDCTCCCVVMS